MSSVTEQQQDEFSHEEVVEALLELVELGELAMGVDPETGGTIWWVKE